MGFYGNITNLARTSFTFDRTYPNRMEMDMRAGDDDVYVGRYVLVEYDTNHDFSNGDTNIVIAYKWLEDIGDGLSKPMFSTIGPVPGHSTGGALISGLTVGRVIAVPGAPQNITQGTVIYNLAEPEKTTTEFWKCTGSMNGINTFEGIVDSNDPYTQNYNIDVSKYGNGRGYDSTVWQKVVQNNEFKYVMVAELNSVVPTFGITPDSPTMIPMQPHWSSNSTNVYYELHWPMPWSIRIKGAKRNTITPRLDEYGRVTAETSNYSVVTSTDEKEYPNDSTTVWKKTIIEPDTEDKVPYYASWDKNNNKIVWVQNPDNAVEQPAAIYYNKAGLDPEVITYSKDNKYMGWGVNGESGYVKDEIKLEPTGRSGYGYNRHGSNSFEKDYTLPDSMELSVMLPTIGDAIAHMWDLVYGGRYANANNEDEVDTINNRNLDISWEDGRYYQQRKGLRLVPELKELISEMDDLKSRYRPDRVETIAGAINSVHDLLGMILVPTNDEDISADIDNFDENKIYYNKSDGEYYRKKTGYVFTPINEYYTVNLGYAEEGSPYDYINVQDLVTIDNFDANLLFVKVVNNGETSYLPVSETDNPVYNDQTEYYARTYKEEMQPYKKAENLITFRPNECWFKDYVGSPASEDPLKHDFCQDEYYQYGKEYYTITDPQVVEGLADDGYAANLYWYINDRGDFILDNSETITAGRQYYQIVDIDNQANSPYKLTNFTNLYDGIYIPGKYYYKDLTGAFKISNYETMALIPDRNLADTSFYVASNNTITIEGSSTVYSRTFIYYNVSMPIENRPDESKGFVLVTEENYTPGVYYVLKDGAQTSVSVNTSVKEEDFELESTLATFDPTQTYWVLSETLVATNDTSKIVDIDNPLSLMPFTNDTFYLKETSGSGLNRLIKYRAVNRNEIRPAQMGYYVMWNADADPHFNGTIGEVKTPVNNPYDWTTNLVAAGVDPFDSEYGAFAVTKFNRFFDTNKYHRVVQNEITGGVDYLLATETKKDPNATYVLLSNSSVKALPVDSNGEPKFYYPYKFYQKVGDTYHLVTTAEIPYETTKVYNPVTGEYDIEEIVYEPVLDGNGDPVLDENEQPVTQPKPVDLYLKNSYYVDGDTTGIHQAGEEWNSNIKWIPSTVRLAVREDYNIIECMPGFARGLSTIHGMILKLWQILELNDEMTRDTRTARGLMNTMNDVLKKFHELVPGNLVYINDYGQIDSAPISHDDWIKVTLNSRVKDPSFIVEHTFNEGSTLEDGLDLNDPLTSADTIPLYVPEVDDMGHVVGSTTTTVTLPYGFKTVGAENSAVETLYTDPANATRDDIVAENTLDRIDINAGNKWIRLATDATNDALTIAHQTLTPTVSSLTAINQNDKINNVINDKITVYEVLTDNAGHVTHNQPKEITLPYGYKVIKASNSDSTDNALSTVIQGGQVADNTQDELTIASSNKWTKIDNNTEDTIKIGHLVQNINTTAINNGTPTDINGNGDTITLKDFTIDEAGHVRTYQDHIYTLPYGFKTIAASNNSDVTLDAPSAIALNGLVADSTQDTLTFEGSNKWIKIDNATEDTVKIGHEVNTITKNLQETESLSLRIGTVTFPVDTINEDEAGHITERTKTTYTMPMAFGAIRNANNPFYTYNAKGTSDILYVQSDAWLETTIEEHLTGFAESLSGLTFSDTNMTQISISHKDALRATQIVGPSQAMNLEFGNSFNLPQLGFDAKGHYVTYNNYGVTLPTPSMTYSGEGSLVTNVSLTPATGAFVVTKAEIGSLPLTNYIIADTAEALTDQDTLNEALGKLEKGLNDEIIDRSTAIADAIDVLDMQTVNVSIGEIFDSITQENGYVSVTTRSLEAQDIPDIEISQVIDTNNNTTLSDILNTKLNNSDASATYLTLTNAAESYLTKNNASREYLTSNAIMGSYETTSIDPSTNQSVTTTAEIPYSELYSIISNLNDKISELESKVQSLEPIYHNITIILDDNLAEFDTGSFEGGQVLDGLSITISIVITDLNVSVTDWYINNSPISNTSLTYTYTPIDDDIIEIRFTADEYTITYDGNGNTNEVDLDTLTQTKYYDTALLLRSHATFAKDTEYIPNYKITFNSNGGYSVPNPIYALVRNTFYCDGWNINSPAGSFMSSNSYITNASAKLYAHWHSSETPQSITLPDSPIPPSGQYFDEWYTAPVDGTRIGGANDSYTPNADMTLYAHWSDGTYTITYNGNGSTDPVPEPQTKIREMPLTLSDTILTRPNEILTGSGAQSYNPKIVSCNLNNGSNIIWNVTLQVRRSYQHSGWLLNGMMGTGMLYSLGAEYLRETSCIMYAAWIISTGVVRNITLPNVENSYAPEGKTFDAWYTDATNGTKVGNGGETYAPSANITLYAHWKTATYTITYNGNGYTSGTVPSALTKYHNSSLTLSSTTLGKANGMGYTVSFNVNGGSGTVSPKTQTITYAHDGWATSASGAKAYNKGAIYSTNENLSLFAHWTVIRLAITLPTASRSSTSNTRTVNFIANGGTVTLSSLTSSATINYIFNKWHLNSTSGAEYSAGASFTPAANCTMYASWTPSTGAYSSITLPTPTKSGFVCTGWYTDSSGGTKRGDAGDLYIPPASENLYAQWAEIT